MARGQDSIKRFFFFLLVQRRDGKCMNETLALAMESYNDSEMYSQGLEP